MRPLTDTQKDVIRYLRAADHASVIRIRTVTGGNIATLHSLAVRGLIEPHRQASYRITSRGRLIEL